MSTEKKELPKNDTNDSKPVQEALPSSEQRPMGSEQEIEKNERYQKEKDDSDTNSVGIKK